MPYLAFAYCRQAQNDTKKQNHTLIERVQALQSELQDNEVRRDELEGQVRQGHTVSVHTLLYYTFSLVYTLYILYVYMLCV